MSETRGRTFRVPSEWRIVALLVVAAALLRLRTAVLRGDGLSFDESMHVILGRNLLAGRGYSMNDLPNATFPFLLSLLAGLGDLAAGPRWALMAPTIVLGAAALVPLYLLTRRIAGRTAAFAAALFYVGLPALLHFTPFVPYAEKLYEGGEHVYIFFFLFAAYFACRAAETDRLRDCVLGGLFAGAAFEVRQDGALVAAALAAWLALAAVSRRRWSALSRAGAFAAAALVVALPFIVHVRTVTGAWYSGPRFSKTFLMRDDFGPVLRRSVWKKALASYFRLNDEGDQLETAYYGVSPWHKRRIAEGHERVALGDVLRDLRRYDLRTAAAGFRGAVVPPLFGAPLALGLIALLARPGRLLMASFFAALVLPAAFIAAALYPLPRFSMYLAPVAALVMGCGAAFVFETAFSKSARLAPWAGSAAVVIAAGFCVLGAWQSVKAQDALHAEPSFARTADNLFDHAAEWLKMNTPPGARVMASSPQAPLLAGREWLAMPLDTGERVVAYARARGADYAVQMVAGTADPPAELRTALVVIYSAQSRRVLVRALIYDLSRLDAPAPANEAEAA